MAMSVHGDIMQMIMQKVDGQDGKYLVPPPVFLSMQGEFLAIDLEAGTIKVRFPVLDEFLNPFGSMQGGMIAAAADNSIGPLSFLVAPANVTRNLEMKYSRPATSEMEFIVVEAELLERDARQLYFRATVFDKDRQVLARAKATHWIVDV